MALPAHCAYCFEVLSASLEKRQPISLTRVEEQLALYQEQQQAAQTDRGDTSNSDVSGDQLSAKPAAVNRLLSSNDASSSSSPSSTPSTPASEATERSSSTAQSSSSRSSLFSVPRLLRKAAETSDYPLFVTWNTLGRDGDKYLRGCIGTFDAQPLADGLRSYALTAAFEDTRFHPIPRSELPTLECGVTLLTDFEDAPDDMAWEVGKHGIRISFTWHGKRFGATYLPDVAKEQGWTKEETMVSLMKKAGWSGRRSEWRDVQNLKVVRYQGSKATLDYGQWREWRDWVSKVEG